MTRLTASLFMFGILLGYGCKDSEGGACFPGNEGCACISGGCLPGLECAGDVCVPTGDAPTTGVPTTGAADDATAPSSDGEPTTSTTGDPPVTTTGDTAEPTTSTTSTTTTDTSADDTSTTDGAVVLGFFVSSTGSGTGDLGGLAGADARCQQLADAVGSTRTWHAYLSVEKGAGDLPEHAKDRIGQGPWYNAELVLVAADLTALHALEGDPALFLDEHGERVPGQWEGSPTPNEHDILTGSNKDGTVTAGKTCADWTSGDAALFAQVGHSDGLGPMMSDAEQYRSWNSVHESGGCNDTAPKGGAGRIYCFAID